MMSPASQPRKAGPRDLFFVTHPEHWPAWPYLPVVRRRPGAEEECGLLYDARGVSGRLGYSATVFVCNLFLVPRDEAEFLALPRETYDTPEEVAAAGWVVD